MFLICVFSRNRERCSEEKWLDSAALYDSERSAAGSSHANYQYMYTTEKISSFCLIYSPVFVQKRGLLLNLNLIALTLTQRSILVIGKQLFLQSVCH